MWDDRDVRCGRTVMAWMAASSAAMTGERWLGPRYRECVARVEAALARGATLTGIFGEVDAMKWRSSREVTRNVRAQERAASWLRLFRRAVFFIDRSRHWKP